MLCNACLHRLDRAWQAGEHGVLVRYADDAVVMCDTREQAEAALARLTVLLAGLGLEPKAAKTRIVQLAEGNPGFDFLGFHHRLVRGRTPKSAHLTFLARWPSRKAAQHARDRIREITGRERLLVPAEVIVTELNRFLRGSGPGISATETRPASSARSGTTRSGGWGCGCPKEATGATAGGGA